MKWYLKVLNHYADFSGRARRKEYWMFNLIYALFIIIILILSSISGGPSSDTIAAIEGGLFLLFVLLHVIPSIAVTVRRLHDTGKNGWMILIAIIPLGVFWLLVLMLDDSDQGENHYGPNPKEVID